MRTHAWASIAAAIVVGAGTAGAVSGDVRVTTRASQTSLSFGSGSAFHTTSALVSGVRSVPLPGGGSVALWNETSSTGQVKNFYAMSGDGAGLLGRVRETTYTIRVRYANFDPLASVPAVPQELRAPAGSTLHIVQCWAPPVEAIQSEILGFGGEIHRFMSDHAMIVSLDALALEHVKKAPYVRWVGPFHPAYKIEDRLLSQIVAGDNEPAEMPPMVTVEVFRRGLADQLAIAGDLRAAGVKTTGLDPDGFVFHAEMTPQQLLALAQNNAVHGLFAWGPGETDMDVVRQISGANYIESTLGFTGQGVRGEIFDTGIYQHIDVQLPQPPLMHGTPIGDSHGMACYGINFGTGAGNVSARGLLPNNEQGVFAQYDQVTQFGGSKPRAQLTAESVDPAGPYRVVFQTASVGSPRVLNYTPISFETDDYLFVHGLLSTQSQSNAGDQMSRPQAWAKNIVSVGGINHQNTLTKADDAWSFGASIGPAEDGRIKPDLAHFYDATTTTYVAGTTGYGTFGGTSNATPITAGHFGLFHQMWHEGVFPGGGGSASVFASRPKMTLAKAILINTASRYVWTSGGPNADIDRFKQGWGMADLQRLHAAAAKFNFVNESEVLSQGQSSTFFYNVQSGTPEFNVTMTYADPAGTTSSSQHRINDLSLRVTSPGGQIYWGNNGLTLGNWSTAGGTSNTKDTVENVFVQNPAAGQWVVEVLADEIVQDAHTETPQIDADYALVVTGGDGAPGGLFVSLQTSVPSLVAPGTALDVQFKINPGSDQVVAGSEKLFYRTSSSQSFQQITLAPLGGNVYEATLPAAACNTDPEFYAQAEGVASGLKTSPPNAPTSTYGFDVGTTQTTVFYTQNFEAGLPSGSTATGLWNLTTSCTPGASCEGPTVAYYGVTSQCNFNTGSTTTGTLSIPVNLSSAVAPISLTYCYARDDEGGSPWDNAEVRFNGQPVDTNPPASPSSFTSRTVSMDQFAGQTGTLEFFYDSVDSVANSTLGWMVDGISISTSTIVCNSCYPDCDSSGTLNIFDYICFGNAYSAQQPYADCDGSGTFNIFDYICFGNAYAAGCP